jgi:hypothetical protein
MWQRIQTLYLVLAMAVNLLLFVINLASLSIAGVAYSYGIDGIALEETGELAVQSEWLMLLALLSILLSLVIIFLFNKRQLQIKLAQLNLFVQAAFVVTILLLADSLMVSLVNGSPALVEYGLGTYLSVLPLVFLYLAIRGIKKDEALVRAADRIR